VLAKPDPDDEDGCIPIKGLDEWENLIELNKCDANGELQY
jgi:hypothetical protein